MSLTKRMTRDGGAVPYCHLGLTEVGRGRLRLGGLTEETAQKRLGPHIWIQPLFIKPFTDAVRKGFHRIRA